MPVAASESPRLATPPPGRPIDELKSIGLRECMMPVADAGGPGDQ